MSANREPFIQDGQVDIVVATYTINDERKKVVDFAGPYYVAGQDILVSRTTTRHHRPRRPRRQDGLLASGLDAGRRTSRRTTPTPSSSLLDAYTKCLEPLRNGQVDAVTTDNVILAGFVDQNEGEFKLVGEPFTEEPYGIGLQEGRPSSAPSSTTSLEASYEDGRWADGLRRHRRRRSLATPTPPTVDRY